MNVTGKRPLSTHVAAWLIGDNKSTHRLAPGRLLLLCVVPNVRRAAVGMVTDSRDAAALRTQLQDRWWPRPDAKMRRVNGPIRRAKMARVCSMYEEWDVRVLC